MSRKHDDDDKSNQKTTAEIGPYKWMAPESIQGKVYNEKTDVYMFGSTMWEIMYGKEPWEDDDPINVAMKVCMKEERPEFEWDLPAGMKTLIRNCWKTDPEQRLTFDNIFKRLVRMQGRLQEDIQETEAFEKPLEKEEMKKQREAKAYASYDPELYDDEDSEVHPELYDDEQRTV